MMKTASATALAFLLAYIILTTASCDARSVRIKRQSTAMQQFNRRRRDLWEAYRRLTIIYNRIRSQSSVRYVPATVERAGNSLNGTAGMKIINDVLGETFPTEFRKPTAHMRAMGVQVRRSLVDHPAQYVATGDAGRVEVSGSTGDDFLQVKRSYPGNGIILRVLTHVAQNENSRRKQDNEVNEIVHLCGQINKELMSKSLKLKCEVVLDEVSS